MKFDLAKEKFMIAIPVNRDFPWQTVKSLMDTVIEIERRGIDYQVQLCVGSSIIETARTKVAHEFLNSDCTKLFMIDSDQTWTPDTAIRIMALSTVMPVVLGAYPAKKEPITFMLKPVEDVVRLNEYGCVPIEGIGLGFTIVDRYIISQLADYAPKLKFPDSDEVIAHIFRCDHVDGVFRGEDMAFFSDIRELGFTVYLDPSLEIGHVGGKEYKGSIMDGMEKVQ